MHGDGGAAGGYGHVRRFTFAIRCFDEPAARQDAALWRIKKVKHRLMYLRYLVEISLNTASLAASKNMRASTEFTIILTQLYSNPIVGFLVYIGP
jgi:hypothetical protein